jgi:RNA polymerase sigma-70 factor (ECF subfamily)
LIARGFLFLEKSSTGSELTEFHLQAGIASLHCAAAAYEQTNWAKIVELYDELYKISPSPVVALNRAIALGSASGPEDGLCALRQIAGVEQFARVSFLSGSPGRIPSAGTPSGGSAEIFQKSQNARTKLLQSKFFGRKLTCCQLGFTQLDVPG